jgi:hypothetical protein
MNGAYLTPKQRAQVNELTALGFPFDASANALYETKGNLEAAKVLLVSMFGASDQVLQYQQASILLPPTAPAMVPSQMPSNMYQNIGLAPYQALPNSNDTAGAMLGAPLAYVGLPPERPLEMDRPLPTPQRGAAPTPVARGGVDSPAFRRATLRAPPGSPTPPTSSGSPSPSMPSMPPSPQSTLFSGTSPASPAPAPVRTMRSSPVPVARRNSMAPAPGRGVAIGLPPPTIAAAPVAAAATNPGTCELCTVAPSIVKMTMPSDNIDRWLCQGCVLRAVSGVAAAPQVSPAQAGYMHVPIDTRPTAPAAASPSPKLAPGRGALAVPIADVPPRAVSPPRGPPTRGGSLDHSAANSIKSMSSVSSGSTMHSADTAMSREEKLAALEAEFDCFPPDYIEEVLEECLGVVEVAHQLLEAEREQNRPGGERDDDVAPVGNNLHSDDEDDAPPAFSAISAPRGLPREYFDGVEDLAPYMWFHGMVRAEDCDRLLQGKPPGSFFVRNSSRPDHFVIVWVTVDKTTAGANKSVHILVQPHKNGGLSVDTGNGSSAGIAFRRLADVIDHYSKHLLQTFAPVRAGGMCDEDLAEYRSKMRTPMKAYVSRDGGKGAAAAAFLPVFSGGPGGGGGGGSLVKAETLYYDGVLNLGQFNWFHGVLSVEQASKLLKGCQKGTFVVRISKKTSKYVIVWVSDTEGSLVHILIDSVDGDPIHRYKVDSKKGPELYRNVPAVIQRYSKRHLTNVLPCTSALAVFDETLRKHKQDTGCKD